VSPKLFVIPVPISLLQLGGELDYVAILSLALARSHQATRVDYFQVQNERRVWDDGVFFMAHNIIILAAERERDTQFYHLR
jgi:hypothetical protein